MVEKEYISREEIFKFPVRLNHYDIEALKNFIDSIPAADVAPVKHGHWIWKDNYRDYDGYICSTYSCSNCEKIIDTANLGKTLYCPKCGSKMNKGDDAE